MEIKIGDIIIPVLPESYTVSEASNHTTVQIQTTGERLLVGNPNLATLQFQSTFPASYRSYCSVAESDLLSPIEYYNKLKEYKDDKTPVAVLFADKAYEPINRVMVIADLQWGESDSSGDIEYTISLTHYLVPSYSKMERDASGKKYPKTYVVKKDHTSIAGLKKVAKRFYGASKYSTTLYKNNKTAIEAVAKKHKKKSSHKGKYLYKGTKLVIYELKK